MKNLTELAVDTKARIVKVDDAYLNLMMIAKGLVLGTTIEVKRKTFWGSCMYIRCASHSIAIQTKLAKQVIVEEL